MQNSDWLVVIDLKVHRQFSDVVAFETENSGENVDM